MDVRVMILWHPGNTYHASVMAHDLSRMWSKMYPSKLVCAIDLGRIGLLTIMDQDEVLKSDFVTRERVLMTHTSVEVEVLEQEGFNEFIPPKLN
jgi:hypothetical protein